MYCNWYVGSNGMNKLQQTRPTGHGSNFLFPFHFFPPRYTTYRVLVRSLPDAIALHRLIADDIYESLERKQEAIPRYGYKDDKLIDNTQSMASINHINIFNGGFPEWLASVALYLYPYNHPQAINANWSFRPEPHDGMKMFMKEANRQIKHIRLNHNNGRNHCLG